MRAAAGIGRTVVGQTTEVSGMPADWEKPVELDEERPLDEDLAEELGPPQRLDTAPDVPEADALEQQEAVPLDDGYES